MPRTVSAQWTARELARVGVILSSDPLPGHAKKGAHDHRPAFCYRSTGLIVFPVALGHEVRLE